jgi:hypothetical protein
VKVEITLPGDLPPLWQRRWADLVEAYIEESGDREPLRELEDAAFKDIRKAYLDEVRGVLRGQKP